MELNLNFLSLPQTYGGFAPDRPWHGLELLRFEAGAAPASTAAVTKENCPIETCCQVA